MWTHLHQATLEEMLQNFAFADRGDVGSLSNQFPRYNGAPSLYYPIIIRDMVREPDIMGPVFISARWGLQSLMKAGGRPPPTNARREGIATNGLFKSAYRSRRCLVPISGYFEWKDIHGTGKNKQPYAIAMADDTPFALAGIWDIWRDPATGVEIRNFAAITCPPNEMMATIHDRMPVILHRDDYDRWLSPEPDPDDLMKPYPAELVKMWPIDRKVGSPKNDSADILDEVGPGPTV